MLTYSNVQTSVMKLVMKTPKKFWNNSNLEACFIRSLENLLVGIQTNFISDIFFPEVRLLIHSCSSSKIF